MPKQTYDGPTLERQDKLQEITAASVEIVSGVVDDYAN